MIPKIDSAISRALSLNVATSTMASHGGSGFASTFKLISRSDGGGDGGEKVYFVKIGKGDRAGVMFEG